MDGRKNIWQSHFYTIPRAYMSLIGIWPYHTFRDRCLLFVPMFAFSITILVPQLLYLLIAAADLDDVFSCTPSMWITIIFSFKIGWLMINNRKLKTCLKTMEDDWLSLTTDTERDILRRHTAYGRYITLTYGAFMQCVGILLITKSLVVMLLEDTSDATVSSLVAESKLPLRVEYGEKLDQYLYPMAVHCYLAVFSHISITIAVDSCYIALIRHACGMFAIVGHTLEHIGKDSDSNFDLKPDKVKDDNYNRALDCLRRHLHVIQFAELIESTFTNIFLVSVCLNMIGGSMIGIQVVLNLNDAKDIVEPFAIYIAQLIHLFLQFWPAQFLSDYSILPYESMTLFLEIVDCRTAIGKKVFFKCTISRNFNDGRTDIHDEERGERPSVVSDEIVYKIEEHLSDRRSTIDDLHEMCLEISRTVVHEIVSDLKLARKFYDAGIKNSSHG